MPAYYEVIAYLPNLSGTGHVLITEGLNSAGTEAAGEFLLNREKMRPVIAREPRGWELVLSRLKCCSGAKAAPDTLPNARS